MVALHQQLLLLARVGFVEFIGVVGHDEVVVLGRDEEGWDVGLLDVLDRVQVLDVEVVLNTGMPYFLFYGFGDEGEGYS